MFTIDSIILLENSVRSLLEGKLMIPLPHKRWTVLLDTTRPVGHCSCKGQMFFAKNSNDIVACSRCGLAYKLLLVIDKDAEKMIENYKKKHLV